jgi:hypothetical protein
MRWIPLRLLSQLRPWAPALAIPQLAFVAFWQGRHRRRPQLVHARLTVVLLVFDMRALWPEELITAGQLQRGSLLHRALLWLERC